MTAVLIFKCTERAGVGDYSSRGRGRQKWRDCNNITAVCVHGARWTSNAGVWLVIRQSMLICVDNGFSLSCRHWRVVDKSSFLYNARFHTIKHILRKHTNDFWSFADESRKPTCFLKQPGRGNVVTQFLPNELKFNATPTQKRRPVRNAWLLSGGLTVLVCGEASMLSDLIRKMFLLCLFADFIWRNGLKTL